VHASALRAETGIQTVMNETANLREDLLAAIKDMKAGAIRTGDLIINGPNAAVVIGSGSIDYVSGIRATDPELAGALTILLGHIENLKNEEAARFFGKFTEELKKPVPDKTLLESLWGSVVAAVPTIKSMTDIVAVITKLLV
jgi:hypothetical protein